MSKRFKKLRVFILIIFFGGIVVPGSYATGVSIVNDPLNTILNEARNALIEVQWLKDLALAVDRLKELKAQTTEMIRVHSGLDKIFGPKIGDSLENLFDRDRPSLRDVFLDAGIITPTIEIADSGSTPRDIRDALEEVTGTIPEGNIRPDIVWTEANIVKTFQLAQRVREDGEKTRDEMERITAEARSASPKGAARIQAELQAQTIIQQQKTQELLTEVMKGQAREMAHINREEKEIERHRLKFLDDASEYLEVILGSEKAF